MPIQIPIPAPKNLNIAGGGAHPPRLVLASWFVQGVVTNYMGWGVGGVTVRFIDLDTNISVDAISAISDSAGKFSGWVSPNKAGYRAKPSADYYVFCPAHFDFSGNSPVICFNAIKQTGDQVSPK